MWASRSSLRPRWWRRSYSARISQSALAVLAVAVAGFAAVAGDLLAALATVVIGWLFLNGMLIDQHAVLRWRGTRTCPADGSGGCRAGGNGLCTGWPGCIAQALCRFPGAR